MSLFFSLGLTDPVPFGVCGIDTPEAGQFGSTSNNMYLRLFTNDNGSNYKILSGMAIGSSNISGIGSSAVNNIYLGTILTDPAGSNFVQPTLAIQGRRMGVNYPHTMRATMDIYSADSNVPIALFSSYTSTSNQWVSIAKSGTLGLGTSNPDETKLMDVRGTMVACNILVNTLSGPYPNNTIHAARVSLSNFDTLYGTHVLIEGGAANVSETLFNVKVPSFSAVTVTGAGQISFGSERIFHPSSLITIDGSAYACNITVDTLQGLRTSNTINASNVTFSNVRMYEGQTAALSWTSALASATCNILSLVSTQGAQALVNAAGQWGIQTSNPHPQSRVDIIGGMHACNIVTTKIQGTGARLEIDAATSVLSNLTRVESVRADLLYTGTSNTFPIFTVRNTSNNNLIPALTVHASGRLGIGTGTPNTSSLVDILGAVHACNLRVNTLESTLASKTIDLLNQTTLSNAVLLETQMLRVDYPGGASNSNIAVLQTTGTGTFTVLSSGRVAIRSSNPTAGFALQVNGNTVSSNVTMTSLTGTLGGSNLIDCTQAYASNLLTLHTNTIQVAHRISASNSSTAFTITNPSGTSRTFSIMGDGRVGIGTSNPSSTSNLLLDVRGDMSTCNIYVSQLTGALPSTTINMSQSIASNVNLAYINQVRLTYSGASSNYSLIESSGVTNSSNPMTLWANGQVGLGTSTPLSNTRLDVMGNIRASNLTITSLTGGLSNTLLNATQTTLSNLQRLIVTDEIRMGNVTLFQTGPDINPSVTYTNVLGGAIIVDSLSNVSMGGGSNGVGGFLYNAAYQRLGIGLGSNITPSESLEVAGKVLARDGVQASNIYPMTPEGNIRFQFAKLLDIDQLIVRSNITISTPGLNTITNLPTDVVRLTPGDRLDVSLLPTNTVLLNSSNQIDTTFFPPVAGPTTTTIRTTDAFGLGIRKPAQRFHLHNGNGAVTNGYWGVGLSNPIYTLHVRDSNGPNTTVVIEQQGIRNPFQILGASAAPLLTVTSTGRVGLGVYANSNTFGLSVNTGIANFAQGIQTPLLYSGINGQNNTLSNLGTVQSATGTFTNASVSQRLGIATTNPLYELDVRGHVNVTGTVNMNRILPNSGSNTVVCAGAMYIQGSTTTTGSLASMVQYINSSNQPFPTNVGLYVDSYVQSAGYYATSDRRFKDHIAPLDPTVSLEKVQLLEVCSYQHRDPRVYGHTIGFIAQEVNKVLPEAVQRREGFVPDILQIPIQPAAPTDHHEFYLRIPGVTVGPRTRLSVELESLGSMTVTVQESAYDPETDLLRITLVEEIPAPITFVYGRWANDIHVMDYDRLVALNTSAIQGLLQRVEQLERKLESLV